jgi:hypothetical protein
MVAVAPMTTDEGPDTAAFLSAVEVVASFTTAFVPGRYSGEDAGRLLSAFTRVERLGVAGKTLAAARVAESGAHLRTGHKSAAEGLSARTGDPLVDSLGLLRLGETLSGQPDLEEALREGELSRARADLVADAITANPGKQAELVDGARHDTFTQLKQRCLRAKAEGRSVEDEERHRAALHANRRCHTTTDRDGAFRLDAVLTPEAGASLLSALQVQADRHFRLARSEGRFEGPAAYRADALVALVTGRGVLLPRGGGPGSRAGGPVPVAGGAPTGRRSGEVGSGEVGSDRAGSDGAGSDGAGSDRAGSDGAGSDRAPDPRATMAIRVDLDALRRGRVSEDEVCEVPGVGPVSVEWARQHLGHALLELVIANATDVTTIYRMGRHVPPAILSALLERDPTCVVPGCDRRLGLENDHWVTDYAHGGLVSMENLARLCPQHHRLRTHRGFRLLQGPTGWEWLSPEAPVVPTRARTKGRRRPAKAPPREATDPPLFDPDP